MIFRRVLASIAAMGLVGLCQCSLLFDLKGLDNGDDSGADAGERDPTDGGAVDTRAVDAADDGEGSAPDFDAGETGGGGDTGPDAVGPGGGDTGPDAVGPGGGDAGPDAVRPGGGDAGAADAADGVAPDGAAPDAADGGGPDGTGQDASDAGDPLNAGLLAYYPFDETSGTTSADATGNGHTANMNGATFAAGLVGNAATLGGGNTQYVSLPSGIVAGLTAFSISTWVKVAAGPDAGPTQWSRIFDFGTGMTTYMFLTPNNGTTGTLRFAITTAGNGMEQQLDNAAALRTGSWQHVAIALSGTTGTLYLNGTQVAQSAAMTLNPMSLGATTQNWIGRSAFAVDPYLNGQVDNFRIYGRALTAAEVMLLFRQQK
jgi:concanavalin A-like lectin/glucanase superfamily protein